MNVVIKDYPNSGYNTPLKSGWVYVLRKKPFDVNDSIGEELSKGLEGTYIFKGIELQSEYQLFEGNNIGNLSQVVAFGTKKGQQLFIGSELSLPNRVKPESDMSLSSVIENINGEVYVPEELVKTSDFKYIGLDIDLNKDNINLNF